MVSGASFPILPGLGFRVEACTLNPKPYLHFSSHSPYSVGFTQQAAQRAEDSGLGLSEQIMMVFKWGEERLAYEL